MATALSCLMARCSTGNIQDRGFKRKFLSNSAFPLFSDKGRSCWGDTIIVNVTNYLEFNGTTVHWHGVRQLGTPEMDGVNAVSQCPIAPNDSFVYNFTATQYGTSWYHSHYSLQYADGLLGPITIYGPSSSSFDEGKNPILISDWGHRSAFQDWTKQLTGYPSYPKMNSVLLNGLGAFLSYSLMGC